MARFPDRMKAWLRGWDDAQIGRHSSPYKMRAQGCAWQEGYQRGRRSNSDDVREMKRRANIKKPGTYLEV